MVAASAAMGGLPMPSCRASVCRGGLPAEKYGSPALPSRFLLLQV